MDPLNIKLNCTVIPKKKLLGTKRVDKIPICQLEINSFSDNNILLAMRRVNVAKIEKTG
jgi:hypothetical protein